MVPQVADRGTSFKGAGQYYLHDKDATTAERVEFTHTKNLITNDPHKAIKCMAYTAMHQKDLKREAGLSLRGNQKCDKPVYTYSLSWHPEQEPSKEHMIEAANASLEFLGLDEHEALFVAHSDEDHPHIHVIVNLVHPENGITGKLYKDYDKFQDWAYEYEREHGKIYCEQRAENRERRQNGEYVKYEKETLYDWRRKRLREDFDRRLQQEKDLTEEQKKRRTDLYDAKEKIIAQERKAIRDATRHEWRDLYKKQEEEKAALAARQKTNNDRLKEVLGQRSFGQTDQTIRRRERHPADPALKYKRKFRHKDKSSRFQPMPGQQTGRRQSIFDEPDHVRKGRLSDYFQDTASQTERETPEQQKEREDKNRRLAEKGRADTLKDTLADKDALHRDTAERTGTMKGHFGDKADPLPENKLRPTLAGQRKEHRSQREQLEDRHQTQRNELAGLIRDQQKTIFKEINSLYKDQLESVKKQEREEREALKKDQSKQSQDTAKDITSGRDIEQFDKEQADKKYDAFREMRDEITNEKDRGDDSPDRSIKPPGGPKNE